MNYHLRGFTLIEVLVSLVILAIITTISASLFQEMWSMQKLAASHRSQMTHELMLKTMRNDLNAALIERDGRKNIKFAEQDGELTIEIKRPLVSANSKELFFDTVLWTFNETDILRQIGRNNEPLRVSVENIEQSLNPITNDVAYLRLNIDDSLYNLVIDTR